MMQPGTIGPIGKFARAPEGVDASQRSRPRILVVTLRRIGDVLLTTPLIRSLRRAWPNSWIDVLAFSNTAGILEGNPDIDKVVCMAAKPSAGETARLAARLWRRYDLAISTQSGDRPTLFAVAAGRVRAGIVAADASKRGSAVKRRALHYHVHANDSIHRVEQNLQLADALGIARVPEVVCPAARPDPATASGESFAVIHAAPMFRYKQWTAEGWRALGAGLAKRGLGVVALSGPDAGERAYLEEVWRDVASVIAAPWPKTVGLLLRAKVYVGPDTAVSHLAAACGCPTVALFGPMDPRTWGPWPIGGLDEPWAARGTIQRRGNVWVVQNPLHCLPCTFEGCERHVESYSRCLDELKPAQVLTAVDEALQFRDARHVATAPQFV
jgi:heptosyltransferase III